MFQFESGVTHYYLMQVKPYQEDQQKCSSLVVVFLADQSIVLATLKGTVLTRLQTEDKLLGFSASLSSEEYYFGALAKSGRFYVYNYLMLDSRAKYQQHFKELPESDQVYPMLIVQHSEVFELQEMLMHAFNRTATVT